MEIAATSIVNSPWYLRHFAAPYPGVLHRLQGYNYHRTAAKGLCLFARKDKAPDGVMHNGKAAMSLQLSKMLVKQNVDFQHYLFSQSEAELLRQIQNCMRCRKRGECEAYLAARQPASGGDIHFCPNHDLIAGLRKLQTGPTTFHAASSACP